MCKSPLPFCSRYMTNSQIAPGGPSNSTFSTHLKSAFFVGDMLIYQHISGRDFSFGPRYKYEPRNRSRYIFGNNKQSSSSSPLLLKNESSSTLLQRIATNRCHKDYQKMIHTKQQTYVETFGALSLQKDAGTQEHI